MTKEDIKVIKYAKVISEYCEKHEHCRGCAFRTDDYSCILENSIVACWEIPELKTYKQDFLEKFPKANVETICRADVFGNIENCQEVHDDTTEAICAACWDEMHIE